MIFFFMSGIRILTINFHSVSTVKFYTVFNFYYSDLSWSKQSLNETVKIQLDFKYLIEDILYALLLTHYNLELFIYHIIYFIRMQAFV